MEIRICPVDFDCFVPGHRLHAEFRLPMKFYEGRFTLCVDKAKSVDAEALHEAERAGYRAVGHDPHRHVHAFRRERDKIPEIIVSSLCLRETAIGLLLGSMDQVRELDRILD